MMFVENDINKKNYLSWNDCLTNKLFKENIESLYNIWYVKKNIDWSITSNCQWRT